MQRQRGLTLLELLVVLAIIGFASAGIALSLRDGQQTQLDNEAQRLMAHLEAARVSSRTSGVTLTWRGTGDGYTILRPGSKPFKTEQWLYPSTVVSASTNPVVLGPEPIIAPVTLTLSQASSNQAPTQTVRIGTDGLRPFQVLP